MLRLTPPSKPFWRQWIVISTIPVETTKEALRGYFADLNDLMQMEADCEALVQQRQQQEQEDVEEEDVEEEVVYLTPTKDEAYIRNYNEQQLEQIINHAISGTPFEALDQKLIKSIRAILCAYLHYKNSGSLDQLGYKRKLNELAKVGLLRSAKPSHTITIGYRMLAFYKQAGA
ncbi:hypothetical protein BDB00DRAFT_942386 [Zychaea mexicana]|uniref:uncharacterized protein n=1 Tax=Zychaea mexicana TaxID=64656 RepID=UPI0022FE5B7A|nr:uncharacterized protein BDB00DRAFT_942386 [Zychaea mexicana]KAI9488289.1 hypothetical protein BDB00DRAFT_942386 [Zychaea mexicana]